MASQPQNLGKFYRENPSFLWGPAAVASLVCFATSQTNLRAVIAERDYEAYGIESTVMLTVFAIMCAYATHGWMVTHVSQARQLQSYQRDSKNSSPSASYAEKNPPTAAAVRTVATLLTSLVYALVPFAPPTYDPMTFVACTFLFGLYWDFHFFLVHKACHENRWLYSNVHKLHHTHKQPGVFTAYFVTYQSHFLTEQSVVLLGAAFGLPRNVFTWIMWWGTLATYVEHCGHDVESVRLSPLPITFGQLCTLLGPWSLIFGGVTPAEHDWHHEKFTTNYALSFQYLDKLLGSYHPGREAGKAVEEAVEKEAAQKRADEEEAEKLATATEAAAPEKAVAALSSPTSTTDDDTSSEHDSEDTPSSATEASKPETAQYKTLIESTTKDWLVQGAAFDAYKESGQIVRNVIGLVENMKGELGEIGARVDMYEHSLQTATRARRAGADTETIVCALLHDIGEVLSGTNHGEIAAALLRPYISPMNHWLLANHEVFQAYYFLDKCGGDKDLRDKVREYADAGIVKGHAWYDATEEFCLKYDQPSFNPEYDTDSMASFAPLVAEVFDRKPYWWEPADKKDEELDCKARLAFGYSLDARAVKA